MVCILSLAIMGQTMCERQFCVSSCNRFLKSEAATRGGYPEYRTVGEEALLNPFPFLPFLFSKLSPSFFLIHGENKCIFILGEKQIAGMILNEPTLRKQRIIQPFPSASCLYLFFKTGTRNHGTNNM